MILNWNYYNAKSKITFDRIEILSKKWEQEKMYRLKIIVQEEITESLISNHPKTGQKC